jgi:hypothetical protein
VLLERVVEVQPTLVAQPHHEDRSHALADRAEPVLDVGVLARHLADAGRPGQPAAADDADHQSGRPTVALYACGPGEQDAGGRRQYGIGHVLGR